jgi:hypothetical protein
VIATGYGGNLEFMDDRDALLVRHARSRVGAGAGPYPADAIWAEPDVAHAAALMRQVWGDREAAAAHGRRAAEALAARFAPKVAGAAAAAHVERIHTALARRDLQQQPSAGSTRSSSGPRSSSSSSE